MHGVVFDIEEHQISELDKHEGVGHGYSRKQRRFTISRVEYNVLMYVADADYINDALVPYKWYFDLVVAGAEQHNLPRDYLAGLCAVPYVRDPKPDRETRLEALDALERYRRSRK